MQLEDNPPDIHDVLKLFIDDISFNKNSVIEKLPFERHIGRKMNTPRPLTVDYL